MKTVVLAALVVPFLSLAPLRAGIASPVVDTAQTECFDARGPIPAPEREEAFYGQDAQYPGNPPAYADNGDGTVLDKVTGLTWQKAPSARRLTWDEAFAAAEAANKAGFAGHADWRVPTIRELDSLFLYAAAEPKPGATSAAGAKPFLDAHVFGFRYGDVLKGEAVSDVVCWSATPVAVPPPPPAPSDAASSASSAAPAKAAPRSAYGINFAEGRLRADPVDAPASAPLIANGVGPSRRQLAQRASVRLVRGNADYGKDRAGRFIDNGDGTVSDTATGLLWQKADGGQPMTWEEALVYAEHLSLNGIVRWRLPSAKELESLVDFTRSPDATQSAAIDPVFDVTAIRNEAGQPDFPAYWSGT
ncbi:MAG TPA: DUF1566 domain-containing protein, partial [Candidatus Methylacidiphilales bacterium]